MDELHRGEEAVAKKKAELEAKAQSTRVVEKNLAIADLEQMRTNDPLPLQRAKLNQGAAVRKMNQTLKTVEHERVLSENGCFLNFLYIFCIVSHVNLFV